MKQNARQQAAREAADRAAQEPTGLDLGDGAGWRAQLGQVWRTILPWADLQIKTPPASHLELQPTLIPTLAALVAQGRTAARLLTTDDRGFLNVAADLSTTYTSTSAVAIGGALLTLDSTDGLLPGQFVQVATDVVNGRFVPYRLVLVGGALGPLKVQVTPTLQSGIGIGDTVQRLPAIYTMPTFGGSPYANQSLALQNQALAIGDNTLLAGAANTTRYIHQLNLRLTVAAVVQFKFGNQVVWEESGVGPWQVPFDGLPTGNAISVVLNVSVAGNAFGSVLYANSAF